MDTAILLLLSCAVLLSWSTVKCSAFDEGTSTTSNTGQTNSPTCQLEPSLKNSILKMKNKMTNIAEEVKEIKKFQEDSKKDFGKVLEELIQDALKNISCMQSNKPPKKDDKDCADIYKNGKTESGVYQIDPDGKGNFNVFCDMTTSGGGWTVFQRRLDGSVSFYRGWQYYKHGFGDLNGEFWLGLDKINRITSASHNKLRIDMEDTSANTTYAEYDSFAIASEQQQYKLSIGIYNGTAGDSLSYHKGMAFTTKDSHNDQWYNNCAVQYKGAWWYKRCHKSNLNGLYLDGAHMSFADGVNWYHWKGYYYSLKSTSMKIRPVAF
ncbi:Hypothetical predicted protein [Paramuricea clavata]|uniref:Uncharacterized protein n=1 Tax=Paramuricea clavata TaxID=317549 RepID=A0A6S7J5Z1_PARCT|nr:Hypothetical predicted protein [Paramuricea clavata]